MFEYGEDRAVGFLLDWVCCGLPVLTGWVCATVSMYRLFCVVWHPSMHMRGRTDDGLATEGHLLGNRALLLGTPARLVSSCQCTFAFLVGLLRWFAGQVPDKHNLPLAVNFRSSYLQ